MMELFLSLSRHTSPIQASNLPTCSVKHIAADIGEKIISASPDESFFLPEAPRNIQLRRKNATHAFIHMVPSRAGLHALKYFLLQITEEAEGPMTYIQHIFINMSEVRITRESSFNYSCIYIHHGVFRIFVKVWSLSETANNNRSYTSLQRGKYSVAMSNYLTIARRVSSVVTQSTPAYTVKSDGKLKAVLSARRPHKRPHKKHKGC